MVRYLLDGVPSANPRLFNRALSGSLPSSNSHFSRCMSAYCRVLLNIQKLTSPHWQIIPDPSQHAKVQLIPLSAVNQPILSNTSLVPCKSSSLHGISILVREIFLKDLSKANFPCCVFNWSEPWESHWNQLFMLFIIKHWNHAHKHGAFRKFPLNASVHINDFTLTTVLKRWFMGKKSDIKSGKYLPEAYAQKQYQTKKSRWRKQVNHFSI